MTSEIIDIVTGSQNLSAPWYVKRVEFSPDKGVVDIYVEVRQDADITCPRCAGATSRYGYEPNERTWRHSDCFFYKTFVNCRRSKVFCPKCGVVQIEASFARKSTRFTLPFEAYAMLILADMPRAKAAKVLRCNEKKLALISTAYYTHDGNKNVSDLITPDDVIAAHYEFAPFGAVVFQRGLTAAANPWRFASEFVEADTATVYYNYRHYEPVIGRWLSRDSLEERDGPFLLTFLANNAIGKFDELGQRAKVETIVIGDISWPGEAHKYKDFPKNSFSDILNSDGDCVASLLVLAHGNVDGLGVAMMDASENLRIEDNGLSQISDLFERVCFCRSCSIELRSCYLGSSVLLRERLSKKTGCRITLYEDPVDPDGLMRDPEDVIQNIIENLMKLFESWRSKFRRM